MWDTLREKVWGTATKSVWWVWQRFLFSLFATLGVLQGWGKTAWHSFIGGHGYLAIISFIGVYVGAYSLNEARYELRANRAALARSNFITMVSSGNRGAFIAAMQDFGELQNISVPPEPSLWKLQSWGWFATPESPNKLPLWRWAENFLPLCTAELCGTPAKEKQPKLSGNLGNPEENQEGWRIFLVAANLSGALVSALSKP